MKHSGPCSDTCPCDKSGTCGCGAALYTPGKGWHACATPWSPEHGFLKLPQAVPSFCIVDIPAMEKLAREAYGILSQFRGIEAKGYLTVHCGVPALQAIEPWLERYRKASNFINQRNME